ncbi:hypothetical protein KOR42_14690 [Thalassoglobus neptunius]|uniref:Uncharacterized protein n=1 Tax=Thalassoglobus neptunius TaxID=1938619 RepID=A0A5C5X5R0_9PLAN|nr:hypothetical protein KOR42_14690 [Thalassoglobus neptunius]
MKKPEPQNKSNEVRATGVVRIVQQVGSLQRDHSAACIERTCTSCGADLTLTLDQAGKIPPEQTDCPECFRKLIKEGFDELQRQGIILSTISQTSVE